MSSGPPNPNWASPSQMQEAIALNASFTRAGQRSRPGTRGSGINRGGGSGYAPGRPSNFGAQNMPRPGSGVRADPRTLYTVGPTTPQTIIRPPAGAARTRSRSPTRSASTPATIGPYNGGPLQTSTVPKPASPPKMRASVLVADGTIPMEQEVGMPRVQQQHSGRQLIVSNMTPNDPSKPWIPAHLQLKSAFETIQHLANITGRKFEELTIDGVSIPAPRSRLASRDAAGQINQPSWTEHAPAITVAGQTDQRWPEHAAPPPGWPEHAAPAGFTVPDSTVPPNTRTEVDPNAWMAAYANKNNNMSVPAARVPTQPISEPSRVASYSDMDVDMDDGGASRTIEQPNKYQVGTLADSMWATAPAQSNGFGAASTPATTFSSQQAFRATSNPITTFQNQQPFGAASTPTATFSSQQSFSGMQNPNATNNQNRNTFGSMENVKPAGSGNPSQLNATTANFASVLTQALAASKPGEKLASLQDSRWA